MTLEQLLAQDRMQFERGMIADTTISQFVNLSQQYDDMFSSYIHNTDKRDELIARINLMAELIVTHKAPAGIGVKVLRSMSHSKDDFPGYQTLRTYVDNAVRQAFANKPGLVRKRITSTAKPFTGVSVRSVEDDLAKIAKLQGMVKEYQDWTSLMSQQRLHGNYDPKNHPSKDQLRVRDSLMVDIQTELDIPFLARLLTMAEHGIKQ